MGQKEKKMKKNEKKKWLMSFWFRVFVGQGEK